MIPIWVYALLFIGGFTTGWFIADVSRELWKRKSDFDRKWEEAEQDHKEIRARIAEARKRML